jgi:hypothetical protein
MAENLKPPHAGNNEIVEGFSPRDAEFVKALREVLSTPSQEGGKTSRRVFIAFQVYHENDKPRID